MILSQTCEIAIRSVSYIASKQELTGNISVKELAQSIDENQHTIAKVLQLLAKQGIVSSTKGASGGFYLKPTQLNKTIIHIARAIDGHDVFEKCLLGLRNCSGKRPCPMHAGFSEVRSIIQNTFRQTKIKDLAESLATGKTFLI